LDVRASQLSLWSKGDQVLNLGIEARGEEKVATADAEYAGDSQFEVVRSAGENMGDIYLYYGTGGENCMFIRSGSKVSWPWA